jgi:uncharacterized protein YebE (UPF0316 family)
MYIKLIIVFILGIIETWLYTGWCLKANQGKVWSSSVLMIIYMTMYLTIISWAIKDANTFTMIVVYALSCGVGNFLRITQEQNENRKKL